MHRGLAIPRRLCGPAEQHLEVREMGASIIHHSIRLESHRGDVPRASQALPG